MAHFCSQCGHELPEGSAYCPSCGGKASTLQPVSGTPPNYPSTGVQSSFGAEDAYALTKLNLVAIISLIGFVVGYSISFWFDFYVFSLIPRTPTSATPNPFQIFASTNFILVIALSVVIGGGIELFCLIQLRQAFKRLASISRLGFGTQSTLTLLAIFTLPIIFLGLVLEFYGLGFFFANFNPSQPSAQLPPGFGYVIAGGATAGVAGVVALVGLIGGVILGVWRMGSRYDETLFKVGSILYVIPLANIVSPILLLIGVRSARRKLTSGIGGST